MEEKTTFACTAFLFAAGGFCIAATQFVWAIIFLVVGVIMVSLREARMEFREMNRKWGKI